MSYLLFLEVESGGGERDRGRWEIRRYGIFYFSILLSVKVCLWLREYVFKDYDEDEVKLKIAQKQSNPLKILIFVKKPKFKMRSSVNAEISVKLFFY